MRKIVYSLYDKKAVQYGQPMFVANVAVMMRALTDELKGPVESWPLFVKHPEDFALFELGVFEDGIGVFTMLEKPRLVCEVVALVDSSG